MNKSEILLSIDRVSASFSDGVSEEIEKLNRVFGCELIQEAGILLQLPQVFSVTAQNIFHRFYYRKSLKTYDAFSVSMGCLLLSTKLEEKPLTLREILFVYNHIYQRRKRLKLKPLDIASYKYSEWKNNLILTERYILKQLGFRFYEILDHPHKYLLYFVRLVDGSAEMAQLAWNYLNDAMRCDIVVKYPAEAIACAGIYMASRQLGQLLPESPADRAWWRLMTDSIEVVLSICDAILSLYTFPKIMWIEPLSETDIFSREVCSDDEPVMS
eukprot:gene18866-24651_t